ncbi:MAG: flagellar hook-associated protein FlgL [Zoogloea sp.]|nr:flagellar hook-associated protein FlgL [Zoogloea sp.]
MRITTGMIYDLGLASIQNQTASMVNAQQQMSTGKRILSPSDDPIASARVLEVSQSKSVNDQMAVNQGYASDALTQLDSTLGSVNDLLTYVRSRVVEAGNGTYSAGELQSLATDLRGQYDSLLSLANSTGSDGQYMFAGFKTDAKPFTGAQMTGQPTGGPFTSIQYAGDSNQRTLQVSTSRNMPTSAAGTDVFSKDPVTGDVKIFKALSNFIGALETPGTNIPSAVSTALAGMDQALDQVSTAQATTGARENELESLKSVNGDLNVQYQETISRLQDVDPAKAISTFTLNQTYLQAAQQAFLKVSNLSLFNYLS